MALLQISSSTAWATSDLKVIPFLGVLDQMSAAMPWHKYLVWERTVVFIAKKNGFVQSLRFSKINKNLSLIWGQVGGPVKLWNFVDIMWFVMWSLCPCRTFCGISCIDLILFLLRWSFWYFGFCTLVEAKLSCGNLQELFGFGGKKCQNLSVG